MEKNSEVVGRIRRLVDESHLSVRKFSMVIGVPQSTLNSILNESRSVNWPVIESISKKFDITTDWLIKGIGPGPSGTIVKSNVNIGTGNTIRTSESTATTNELKILNVSLESKVESLQRENEVLRDMIKSKDETIAGKERMIAMYEEIAKLKS